MEDHTVRLRLAVPIGQGIDGTRAFGLQMGKKGFQVKRRGAKYNQLSRVRATHSRVVRVMCVAGLFVATTSAHAQGATLTLVPDVNRISPGGVVRVDVFVNNVIDDPSPSVTNFLRGFQITVEVVPLVGAIGSLAQAPIAEPLLIDQTRSDYVFLGLSTIMATNPDLSRLGATLLDSGQSVEVLSSKYCGTYFFQASGSAEGDFEVRLVSGPDDTFLIESASFDALIPFDPFSATVTVEPVAGNDDCTNSVTIIDGVTPFSTVNTTTSGPALPGTCDEGFGTSFEHDVWYDYTASCTGILTLSTCNDADFDTRLAVYGNNTASCVCPVDNSVLMECNDNATGCTGGTSEVVLPTVTQGICYKLRVGGSGVGQEGIGDITITCVGNDTCGTAPTLSVPSATGGATLNALPDAGLPACGAAFDSPGVWYSIIGTGGLMTASLCGGASYDSRVTVFEGACGSLSCVDNANDTCASQESASWCSTTGVPYKIMVSGVGGQEGVFTLNVSSAGCDDNNGCTDDSCNVDRCENTLNYDQAQFCCTRSTGGLCSIDDSNPCTNDSCNVSTGTCIHSPVPDRTDGACDDGLVCTLDECIGGSCTNTQVDQRNISCSVDSDCPVGFCENSFCTCGAVVELRAEPGNLSVAECFAVGDNVEIRVELTVVPEPIVGAQFFLSYDNTTLDFISMEPGGTVDPTSPFSLELNESVDEALGTIDYLILVNFGSPAATDPSTLAVIRFQAIGECDPFVTFRPTGPNGEPNRLAGTGGVEIDLRQLPDLPPISTDGSAPVLTACPSDITTTPDPGTSNAAVTWTAPMATDSCDGSIAVTCSRSNGSIFSVGTTTVTCGATNSCGVVGECSFDVTVVLGTLTVDVELSPTMSPTPFVRCITFDLWDCDATGQAMHAVVERDLTFSGGLASGVSFDIPGGAWECLTVRDRLHTLRSTAADFTTLDGISFTASLTGARAAGGHWLLSGNLNDDEFIDILDFAVFLTEFLSPADPDSPCGTQPPDANINGDNVVDLVDFVFVQVNSFQAREPGCCGSAVAASSDDRPIMEISVNELRRRGLYHLRFADLNGDGMLDAEDVAAFLAGEHPITQPRPHKDVRSGRSLRPN